MAGLYSKQLFTCHTDGEGFTQSGYLDFPFMTVVLRDINCVCTIGGDPNTSVISVSVGGFWVAMLPLLMHENALEWVQLPTCRWKGRQVVGGEAEWVVTQAGPGAWDILCSGYALSD